MAQKKARPMLEFVKEVMTRAFGFGEAFFGAIREDRKKKNTDFILSQLMFGVPERFFDLIETTEDPETIVNEAIARLKNFSPPYDIQPVPGEFTKERFEEALAMLTASHIVNMVFGGPESGSRFSRLTQDANDLHTFVRQKHETVLAETDMDDDDREPGERQLVLNEEEKVQLASQFSRALFSVHLLVRKIGKKTVNTGQYL